MIIPDMQIKAITFDWGDTLAANHSMPYRASQERAFEVMAAVISDAGYAVSDSWIDDCFDDLYTAWERCMDPQHNPEHQELDLEQMMGAWIDQIDGAINADLRRIAIDAALFHLTEVVVPFGQAVDTLRQLQAAGYRIGILSHVAWQRRGCEAWFERHGFAPYIDFYSLSSEIGWIKPNPIHYQHATACAGCAPAEILHVGDHPQRDIIGAQAFGMRTCLKRTQGIYDESTLESCSPDYNILHVKELLSLLPTD